MNRFFKQAKQAMFHDYSMYNECYFPRTFLFNNYTMLRMQKTALLHVFYALQSIIFSNLSDAVARLIIGALLSSP